MSNNLFFGYMMSSKFNFIVGAAIFASTVYLLWIKIKRKSGSYHKDDAVPDNYYENLSNDKFSKLQSETPENNVDSKPMPSHEIENVDNIFIENNNFETDKCSFDELSATALQRTISMDVENSFLNKCNQIYDNSVNSQLNVDLSAIHNVKDSNVKTNVDDSLEDILCNKSTSKQDLTCNTDIRNRELDEIEIKGEVMLGLTSAEITEHEKSSITENKEVVLINGSFVSNSNEEINLAKAEKPISLLDENALALFDIEKQNNYIKDVKMINCKSSLEGNISENSEVTERNELFPGALKTNIEEKNVGDTNLADTSYLPEIEKSEIINELLAAEKQINITVKDEEINDEPMKEVSEKICILGEIETEKIEESTDEIENSNKDNGETEIATNPFIKLELENEKVEMEEGEILDKSLLVESESSIIPVMVGMQVEKKIKTDELNFDDETLVSKEVGVNHVIKKDLENENIILVAEIEEGEIIDESFAEDIETNVEKVSGEVGKSENLNERNDSEIIELFNINRTHINIKSEMKDIKNETDVIHINEVEEGEIIEKSFAEVTTENTGAKHDFKEVDSVLVISTIKKSQINEIKCELQIEGITVDIEKSGKANVEETIAEKEKDEIFNIGRDESGGTNTEKVFEKENDDSCINEINITEPKIEEAYLKKTHNAGNIEEYELEKVIVEKTDQKNLIDQIDGKNSNFDKTNKTENESLLSDEIYEIESSKTAENILSYDSVRTLHDVESASDISQNSDYLNDSPLDNLLVGANLMEYIEECLNGNESKNEDMESNSKLENWPNDEDSLNNIKRDFYEINTTICSPHPSSESDHAHCVNNLTERVAILSAESILDNQYHINSSDSEMTPTLSSPTLDDSNPELYVEKITYDGKELDVVYFEEALLEEGGIQTDIKIVRTIPVGLGGRIIGKKGKTKNELMKKYGAQLLIYNHPVEIGKQVLEITCNPSVSNQLENWVNKTLDQITKNTIQTTVSNPEWLKPMIPLGRLVVAHIIDMPTIQHIKLRIFDPDIIKAFNKMQNEMNMDYASGDNTSLLPRPVAVGCICVAMIRPDYFLRAQIVEIYGDVSWVYLFDLGKVCQTYLCFLFKIREKYMRVPFQVIPARMPHALIKNKNITPAIIYKRFLCDQKTMKPKMVRVFFPRMNTCCEPCANIYIPMSVVSENNNSEEFVDLLELLVSIGVCSMIRETINSEIQVKINSNHFKAFLNEKDKRRVANTTVPVYFQPCNSKFYEDFIEFKQESDTT